MTDRINQAKASSVKEGRVNVMDFGAVGNGKTDDTSNIKNAVQYALSSRLPLYFPPGVYYVTDTIIDIDGAGTNIYAIKIYGAGISLSTIKLASTTATMPIINAKDCRNLYIEDIGFLGTNKTGIGIALGDAVRKAPCTHSAFKNVYFSSFNIGLDYKYGWILDVYSIKSFSSYTGIKIAANAVNFYGAVVENCLTGIDITSNNATGASDGVTFHGGTVEANGIGFKVRQAGDVLLSGVYLESNPVGHILAGIDQGDRVQSVTIINGNMAYSNPAVFDKVKYVKIEGLNKYPSNKITITDNVEYLSLPPTAYNYPTTGVEFTEVRGQNRQTIFPWYSTDFSSLPLSSPSNNAYYLDAGKVIRISPEKKGLLSLYSAKLTGNKAIKHQSSPGDTFDGLKIQIDYAQFPKEVNQWCVVANFYVEPNTTYFRRVVTVNYTDKGNSRKQYTLYSHEPSQASIDEYKGRWVTTSIPIDMQLFFDNVSDYGSIQSIALTISNNARTAATGNEWFVIDKFAIYPSKYTQHMFMENHYSTFKSLEIQPQSIVTNGLYLKSMPVLPAADATQRGRVVLWEGRDGEAEVASLNITSGCMASGSVMISLDRMITMVPLTTADNTPTAVAGKIRNAVYSGWTTGGTGATVTFTCNTVGTKVDPLYSPVFTGASGVMTVITQGSAGTADVLYTCMRLANGSYVWRTLEN